MSLKDNVTILMPVSPIKSHPDTSIIDNTIASCRFHFPKAKIIIMSDGLREEQESYRERYEEFRFRLSKKLDENTELMEFESHKHQVAMTRAAMEKVTTPVILFVEHDTPIVTDALIEWDGIIQAVMGGAVHSVRLLNEAYMLECHEHLMGDMMHVAGVRLRKTMQWSQRPHAASAERYRFWLGEHFSPEADIFIEHGMHGVAQDHDWDYTKLTIYCPNDINIKRSYHTDGRDGDFNDYATKF